ncbi:hypothetical protein EXIGLDRAFT_287138 [Exidia glandulosa HHB12029]|uniref:Uncharacterized protein n=1 Tax=Exidia glandulosa HHB12029 TaxID=1314781 RepID=A0A165M5Z7_EXIGL|nr:hypothetical protein EXIGLDRAFT_287138 [Exidia glandulosa HHB12029]
MLSVDGMSPTTRTSCIMAAMFALAAMSMAAIFIWVHSNPPNVIYYGRFLDRAGPRAFATLVSLPAALLGYAVLSFAICLISYSVSGTTVAQPGEQRAKFEDKAQHATSVIAGALVLVATIGVAGLLRAKITTNSEAYAPTTEAYAAELERDVNV